jgi:hypothetical protein
MQDKKKTTIAFYSRKLNTAQKRYTTTEINRELLSDIETCKEYKNILLGYQLPIIVFTDHKNNTFNGLKASDRVLPTCWLLLHGEYGVTFEYLPGKRQKNVVADALSRLDIIYSLKIQEEAEEVVTLLSGSENNSISNIEWTIPMHTALIFKEQAKVKETGLREKGLVQNHYSIQHIEGYNLFCYKEKGLVQPHYSIQHVEGYDLLCYKYINQDLNFLIIVTDSKEYLPGTMNIYFIRDRLEQKRLSGTQ